MERAIDVPERIAGERVTLRPAEATDARPWAAAYAADPELGPAEGRERDPDEAELRERFAAARDAARDGKALSLVVADPQTDELLGQVVLHSIDWRHEHAEVGFWLRRDRRGTGAATEAVRLIVDYAFAELGMHRVEMITLPALPNIDRVRALAARLGFREEGVMRERNFERGVRHDTLMLAVLRDEWPPTTEPADRP